MTRRPHTKSRNGCQSCKNRHVKCDEGRPSCQKCRDFGIQCDFSDISSTFSTPEGTPPPDSIPSSQKKRGRPRKGWNYVPQNPANSSYSNSSESTGISNIDDLRLLLQYTEKTALTFTKGRRVTRMWQSAVPELGLKHPFVLELLLSFAAFHLSQTSTDRRDRFLYLAEKHQSAGLVGLTAAIANIGSSNGVAVYVSVILTCYLHLAKGPIDGDYLLFSSEGSPPWRTMFRGIKSVDEITSGKAFDVLLRNVDDLVDEEPIETDDKVVLHCPQRLWFEVFEDLRRHPAFQDGSKVDVKIKILESLSDIFKRTFGTIEDHPENPGETGHLPFAWLYSVDDTFLQLAQERDAVSLVILSFFALLLKRLDSHWWLKGWAEHIVLSIRNLVPSEYHRFIDWSVEQMQTI
ncbi:uncharacterized protein PV09_09094 [Verruconis gallopava]|uniref:Zn(2)-C6 fungal-type domain-containing protein n=1 Tax=Verruconis gallopava TaxID=253628 RepID=A0A0D1XAK2_9PEZI|nr:uncharacterized protein PV09_09094 [Verruconis gallopava]KIV99230.1 hypothetical protein PV09_09094 [Verruconis gallopava]